MILMYKQSQKLYFNSIPVKGIPQIRYRGALQKSEFQFFASTCCSQLSKNNFCVKIKAISKNKGAVLNGSGCQSDEATSIAVKHH